LKKILILDADSNQAIAVAKYIKKYSNLKIVGSVEKNNLFTRCIKYYYDDIIINDYLKVDLNDFDYILPTGAKSVSKIFTKVNSLKYDKIYFSKNNLIVFDKIHMLKRAEKVGVPIPKTYINKNEIQLFPIFYKEKFEKGGGIRGIAYSLEDIPDYKGLIYQEYINTHSTYGVGFLAKDGEIIDYFMHEEILSYPKSGGSGIILKRIENKSLLNYTKQLVKELNYNGWGLAEFKYSDIRNDFIFMEINAKLWASLEFYLLNNSMFLKYLFNIFYNEQKISQILFIDRFILNNSFLDIIKIGKKYFPNSKLIKENHLHCLILKIIIKKIKRIIGRLYEATNS